MVDHHIANDLRFRISDYFGHHAGRRRTGAV